MSATFEIEGQEFYALNGGPMYHFTPAISLYVGCETQAEVDDLWAKLSDGGRPDRCGWLQDRYGLSWQIIPTVLGELLSHPDREKAGRAMQAMLGMTKLDIEALKRAANGDQAPGRDARREGDAGRESLAGTTSHSAALPTKAP
jgi:predicted 3-demethylubiquinone-9 3-methyltransferase (glyoxalase superfamily)